MSALFERFTIYDLRFTNIKLSIIRYLLYAIFLFAFYFLQFSFPKPSFAQTTPLSTPSAYTVINPNQVPPQSPVYTNLMVYNLIHSLSCLGIGQSVIGSPCVDYLAKLDPQGKVSTIPVLSSVNTSGGLLGATGSLLTGLFTNPPLRTSDYLADLGKGFGIIPQAHAQVGGSGSGVLNPILKLWEVSRNLAYLFLIFIFIIIGLMVMFRQKINPQTVITAQAALPGLILGLILITFSYFFAALISDTAFLGTNLVGYYFTAAQGDPKADLLADISNQNILLIFSGFVGVIGTGDITHLVETVFDNVSVETQNFLRFAAGLIAFQQGAMIGHVIPVVGDLASTATGLLAIGVTAAVGPQIFGQVLGWISMAILIYSMLKLLLRLINNLLTIIFLTITAPFQFLAASLPGRQGIATAWFLNMLCNVLVFPAVIAVFYFVAYILGPTGYNLTKLPFFALSPSAGAGLINSSGFPLFGGLELRLINILLAFGALVALPSVPDIICRAIGRVGQAGGLLGQELSTNIRGGQGYANQWQQLGGAGQTIGQKYGTFRGRPPSWSPGKEIQSSTIFGRTINLPGWLSPRNP